MNNRDFWYADFYGQPGQPYQADPDDEEIAAIARRFNVLYQSQPTLYALFTQAQDRAGRVTSLIRTIVLGDKTGVAVEIGAGTCRHISAMSALYRQYVALEPSRALLELAPKPIPPNVSIVHGRFPEELPSLTTCAGLFAFWADVPVHLFARAAERFKASDAVWVMTDPSGEFASLWPRGALTGWGSRIGWLTEHGYRQHIVDTEIVFASPAEATQVLSAIFPREQLPSALKQTIGQRVAVMHKSDTHTA